MTSLRQPVVLICRGALCSVLPYPANAFRPYLLRHPVLAFLNALILCIALGSSLLLSLSPDIARLSTVTASTLTRLVNAERAKTGLPRLSENSLLNNSARLKGEHMIRYDYFEHTSPNGVSPWTWFDTARYAYLNAGENLAIDFTAAEDVVTAWMRSPGHRRNLLSNQYEEIGTAVVTGEFEGRNTTVVVLHLGKRAQPNVAAAVERAGTSLTARSPLAPPAIREPRTGVIVSHEKAEVLGSAPHGSTVDIRLDGKLVATASSKDGTFRARFHLPDRVESDAILTATATRDGLTSSPSVPRRIHIDTKSPDVATAPMLLLPDPTGAPGRAVLVIVAPPDTAAVKVTSDGETVLALSRTGEVFSARLNSLPASPLLLRVSDATGNVETIRFDPPLRFVTRRLTQSDTAQELVRATARARPWLNSALLALAVLFGVNVLAHLRRRRLLHADLLAHAAVVLALGTTALFWT